MIVYLHYVCDYEIQNVAAFILVVAFRYYQQKLVAEEWVEDDVAAEEEGAEETWQGGERATPVDIHVTKQKKGF